MSRQSGQISLKGPRWLHYAVVFGLGFGVSTAYALLQDDHSTPTLNGKVFSTFILRSKEQVSETSSIFTLSPAEPTQQRYDEIWEKGIWSVQVKQPQLQIARAYTPLPPLQCKEEALPRGELRFLIRHDPKGELSGYLHKLPKGANIDLRGPHIEYQIQDDIEEVLFLAGGTGIAPALQIAHALLKKRKNGGIPPRIRILWANRRRQDCEGGFNDTPDASQSWLGTWAGFWSAELTQLSHGSSPGTAPSPIVRMLHQLCERYQGRLVVDYFVDDEKRFIDRKQLRKCLANIPTTEKSQRSMAGRKIVLVSGPDGFVDHIAGPKVWKNGQEMQGQLRGLLAQIDHPGWEVWKL